MIAETRDNTSSAVATSRGERVPSQFASLDECRQAICHATRSIDEELGHALGHARTALEYAFVAGEALLCAHALLKTQKKGFRIWVESDTGICLTTAYIWMNMARNVDLVEHAGSIRDAIRILHPQSRKPVGSLPTAAGERHLATVSIEGECIVSNAPVPVHEDEPEERCDVEEARDPSDEDLTDPDLTGLLHQAEQEGAARACRKGTGLFSAHYVRLATVDQILDNLGAEINPMILNRALDSDLCDLEDILLDVRSKLDLLVEDVQSTMKDRLMRAAHKFAQTQGKI